MKRLIYLFSILVLPFFSLAQIKTCYIDAKPFGFQVSIDSCENEIILDVRPNEMFKNKIIPNAILVPTKAQLNIFCDSLDTETPILVYCTVGMRSEKVCKILCEKEFTNVINLKGGIDKWKKKGFETIELNKK